jgi:hypothetical protein
MPPHPPWSVLIRRALGGTVATLLAIELLDELVFGARPARQRRGDGAAVVRRLPGGARRGREARAGRRHRGAVGLAAALWPLLAAPLALLALVPGRSRRRHP